jgi:hypothetical protein
LASLTSGQVQLKGAVDSDRIVGQAPVETSGQPQAAGITDRHGLLLLNPYPADLGQSRRLQFQGPGYGALGELDLQGKSIQQHRPRRLARATAGNKGKGQQQQHQSNGETPEGPKPKGSGDRATGAAVGRR